VNACGHGGLIGRELCVVRQFLRIFPNHESSTGRAKHEENRAEREQETEKAEKNAHGGGQVRWASQRFEKGPGRPHPSSRFAP